MAQKIHPRSLRLLQRNGPIFSFYGKKDYAESFQQHLWSHKQIQDWVQQTCVYTPKNTKKKSLSKKQRLILCNYWSKQQAYSRTEVPVYFRMLAHSLQSSYCMLTPKLFFKKKPKLKLKSKISKMKVQNSSLQNSMFNVL